MLPLILEKAGNLPAPRRWTKRALSLGVSMLHLPIIICLLGRDRARAARPQGEPSPAGDRSTLPFRRLGVRPASRRCCAERNLDDGTAGLWAVKASGGVTVVQDPADALFPAMPVSALKNVKVDHCLPINGIAGLLVDLPNRVLQGAPPHAPKKIKTEIEFIRMNNGMKNIRELGNPTAFACPSCHGALWELHDGDLMRYRCHTGHAFSPESPMAEQSDAVEQALYSGLRALEEKATALRRLAEHYADAPNLKSDYEPRAKDAERSAESIRTLLNGKAP